MVEVVVRGSADRRTRPSRAECSLRAEVNREKPRRGFGNSLRPRATTADAEDILLIDGFPRTLLQAQWIKARVPPEDLALIIFDGGDDDDTFKKSVATGPIASLSQASTFTHSRPCLHHSGARLAGGSTRRRARCITRSPRKGS